MERKRFSIRLGDGERMLLEELAGIIGTNVSTIIRGMITKCVDELMDKSGNWKVNNEKHSSRKKQ